jgi:L-rhamnose isomerase
MKDTCVGRAGFRKRLRESLDRIYSVKHDPRFLKDSLEPKLFGIGSESCVIGSHDFYISYAIKNGIMICLDLGHYHPTESVADKISSILEFNPELLLHVSRGVRWDSDHVAIFDDPTREVMQEVVRCGALNRVHIALDYFDGSVDRVGAWVAGARATLKSILYALLEPSEDLAELESSGQYLARFTLLEELKAMPFGAVWDYHCIKNTVPAGGEWLHKVRKHTLDTSRKRR